jgi:Flp pilus assembly protein TadG
MRADIRRCRRLGVWRRNQDGATAVEFAFIFPVFVAMIFGIAEFGRALQVYNQLAHAASQASRLVMIDRDTADATIQSRLASTLHDLDPDRLNIALATSTAGGRIYKVISLTYRFEFFSDYIVSRPITLAADASALVD